jgi:hypothetical protein
MCNYYHSRDFQKFPSFDLLLTRQQNISSRHPRLPGIGRRAGPQEKIPLCLEMLRSETPGHRELAVRYLLENGHAGDLKPHAAIDLDSPGRAALIRNAIRKAGWRIIDTDEEFDIKPVNN